MLVIPEESPSLITIIGIDPGTSFLGVCEMTINLETLLIVNIKAYTLNAAKLYTFVNESMIERLGERAWRIYCLQRRLFSIFQQIKVSSIAYEHPFYNPKRPQAFMALLEAKAAIMNACQLHDSTMLPIPIDPSSIKNSVGAKGNVGKDPIREAILKLYPKDSLVLPQGDLDEHSCDAIAVAHCRYLRMFGSRK